MRDLRYVLRGIRRRPGWTTAAVATLALGIGANATMFTLVDRLLLRPPPHVADPGRVVRLALELSDPSGERFAMSTTSFPVFRDVERASRSFAQLAAISTQPMVLGTGGDARAVSAARVSGDYFRLLGPAPAVGRFFGAVEDQPPAGEAVAVLSYALWRRLFDASPSALSREIHLDGARYQVIGVAPPDFTGDDVEPVDVWVPLHAALGPGAWRDERHMRLVRIVGRLADGVTATAAADEASVAMRDEDPSARLVLSPVTPGWNGRSNAPVQARVALWVAAMAVLVLLIAIVNLTNLMLLRGAGRRREMAVRQALGASARDLARAHLVESFVLAALGGIAAVFVAAWATEAIRATLLPTLAAPDALVSTRLIAITLGITMAAGLGSSIVPAWRATRGSAIPDLKQGGSGARAGTVAPNALLIAQGSLCMVLLVAAALFVLSLHRVRTQDFGFTSAGVLLAELRFAGSMNGADQDAVYRRAEEQLRRLPGVTVASVIQAAPFLGHNVPPIAVPDRDDFPDLTQQAPFLTATTPTYFAALGMQLRHGRNFTDADRDGSPLVIIINQAMADGLWPGQDPLGKCIKAGFVPGEMPTGIHGSPLLPCRTVVGVVNNARPRSIREEAGQARMQYYIPFGQVPRPHFVGDHPSIWGLLVRTADAAEMAQPVQRALQSGFSNVQLADVRPLQDVLDRQMRPWLLGATMFSIFGALALGLAAVGLYGVRAYSVAQRTQEIGIRMALGARLPNVVRMVLWEGVRVTAIGIAIGTAVALASSRLIDPLLFEARASDPRIHVVIGLALVIVAILASAVPAWRAARVDPNVALRAE